MNDLETIQYSDVRHPSQLSYADLRKSLKPRFRIVWRDLVLGFSALLFLLVSSLVFDFSNPFAFAGFCLLTSVITGFILAYLALFLHEAGHFNLHPDKKKNDILTNILLGFLFGIDIRSYRKIHWQHHLHLGTESDTEVSYHNALTPSFFLESFTGIYLLKVILKKNSETVLTSEMKKDSLKMMVLGALLNLGIIILSILIREWDLCITWLAGMFIFFPFFATIRQILEHRNELSKPGTDFRKSPHGKVTRIFSSNIMSRLFGAAGFNKHMIHHWDPQISYTRLDEIEQFLSEAQPTGEIISKSKTTYLKTFRKLLSNN